MGYLVAWWPAGAASVNHRTQFNRQCAYRYELLAPFFYLHSYRHCSIITILLKTQLDPAIPPRTAALSPSPLTLRGILWTMKQPVSLPALARPRGEPPTPLDRRNRRSWADLGRLSASNRPRQFGLKKAAAHGRSALGLLRTPCRAPCLVPAKSVGGKRGLAHCKFYKEANDIAQAHT